MVTGRVVEESGESARVELGEGIVAICRGAAPAVAEQQPKPEGKADLSSLTSMLQARWKGGGASAAPKSGEALRSGQVRSFRISKLDPEAKTIELQLA